MIKNWPQVNISIFFIITRRNWHRNAAYLNTFFLFSARWFELCGCLRFGIADYALQLRHEVQQFKPIARRYSIGSTQSSIMHIIQLNLNISSSWSKTDEVALFSFQSLLQVSFQSFLIYKTQCCSSTNFD